MLDILCTWVKPLYTWMGHRFFEGSSAKSSIHIRKSTKSAPTDYRSQVSFNARPQAGAPKVYGSKPYFCGAMVGAPGAMSGASAGRRPKRGSRRREQRKGPVSNNFRRGEQVWRPHLLMWLVEFCNVIYLKDLERYIILYYTANARQSSALFFGSGHFGAPPSSFLLGLKQNGTHIMAVGHGTYRKTTS